jgi:PAS domain S-box-containing protein
MNARLLSNETERLREVRRYAVLDTPHEEAFDRITRMAARLLNVPIATVTLIDETRQWFKSAVGLENRETSRDVSFCAHAILDDAMMTVPDAQRDPRFSDNVLVTGEPHIRAYAGVPLKSSNGFNLGTLCAIDTVARTFSADEQKILQDLAAMVTDELELRLALRERAQQAAAINNLHSGVLATDPNQPDNPIVFCNPAFSAMTGYEFNEIVGRNCRFLQGPDTDKAVVKEIREAIVERRTSQSVLLNYRKDRTRFWNELTITPVFDDQGQLISLVGLQTDVTERLNLESLRENLSHMIIHDLRGPLTTIMGFLDVLKQRLTNKLGKSESRFFEMAQGSASALNEMITSLLDVNRLEAGEMPLNLEECDLYELATNSTVAVRALVGKQKLTVTEPSLPVVALCDRTVIGRVITNLVSNALKFTPGDGEVRVVVEKAESTSRVSVIDTGFGIPAEYHARIFEKFGQVKGGSHVHSTGLGLTFCKLAVEAHGGTIGVQSEPDKGSTFSFTLPPTAVESAH